jgi:hypothetical protein
MVIFFVSYLLWILTIVGFFTLSMRITGLYRAKIVRVYGKDGELDHGKGN